MITGAEEAKRTFQTRGGAQTRPKSRLEAKEASQDALRSQVQREPEGHSRHGGEHRQGPNQGWKQKPRETLGWKAVNTSET